MRYTGVKWMKMKRTCTGVQILEVRVVRGVNRSLLETERDKKYI